MTATLTTTAAPATSTRTTVISVTLGLLAGTLVANGVPHAVFGLLGSDHTTPFGTAAGTNLLWGLANLVVGASLAAPRSARRAYVPFTIGVAAGALGLAISLIVLWS